MSTLEQRLREYLAVRRALGYKLERADKLWPSSSLGLTNATTA